MDSPASPYPALSVSTVVAAVRAQVGNWGLAGLLDVALAMLTYRRVGRIGQRIERLLERFRAGKLWRMPERAAEAGRVGVDRAKRSVPALVMPRRFGWLVRAAAWRAAVYGGQLQLVLEQPEMVELLKVSPQAGRILRPLCRMLLVDTRVLRPGVVVEPPAPKVAKVRVRKPRAKVDWGRIPLPRGMMAAARRQGYGKVPRG
jgi:hypothetical protein